MFFRYNAFITINKKGLTMYQKFSDLFKIINDTHDFIELERICGSNISECSIAGCTLAKILSKRIQFKFNDILVICDPTGQLSEFNNVVDEWWQKMDNINKNYKESSECKTNLKIKQSQSDFDRCINLLNSLLSQYNSGNKNHIGRAIADVIITYVKLSEFVGIKYKAKELFEIFENAGHKYSQYIKLPDERYKNHDRIVIPQAAGIYSP